MATVITVHGTFAHSPEPNSLGDSAPNAARHWWQVGSDFEVDLRRLLKATQGTLDLAPFVWSGKNSETDRRAAGLELLEKFLELEARGERYCVVGHSHGGSVIAEALLEAAAREQPLPGLVRWLTVGTPFVHLKKEKLLFARLDLIRKVAFVASMMLFFMFATYLISEFGSGERMLIGGTIHGVLIATGVMMSLPIIVFYVFLRVIDYRQFSHYRRKIRGRASSLFAARWLALTHPDDEAVQGLSLLPSARLNFFDKSFAVPAITLMSVVALPLLYLALVFSPPAMVALADILKTQFYDARVTPEAERALREMGRQLRTAPNQTKPSIPETRNNDTPPAGIDPQDFWRNYHAMRREFEKRITNFTAAERAARFNQRFFVRNDRPCPGGKLCGGGQDIRVNSALLLHLVTDELAAALGAEDSSDWLRSGLLRLFLPALLVPLLSGVLALGLMLVIRGLAIVVSRATSSFLNRLTNAEMKRAAFGNDTEGEVALVAADRPLWIDRSPPRLPLPLADVLTAFSNSAATQSLAKFRRAIGHLASLDHRHSADSAIATYFTWKELVHASYFDVPEFRRLVAQAIGRTDGFAHTDVFNTDPDFARTGRWLATLETATADHS